MACEHSEKFKLCYAFDLDGTIFFESVPKKEKTDIPINAVVKKVNKLYDLGNHITIFTARHDKSHHETEESLRRAGVKFHRLICSKPLFDFYVCDRAIGVNDFANNNNY